ncbi:phosphate/phosphite/phosphonate ABC transporter substrate-binding protein [Gymnodinialimonas sp.]
MIASLMMYQRPELAGAHDRLWAGIRMRLQSAGMDAPQALSQDAEEFLVWRHPDLVLSQTCGMPFRLWLHDHVALVGTPDYGLEGCAPGYYRSALVVRADDPREGVAAFHDARFAYNQSFSQSGFAAPYWHTQPHGFFTERRIQTGGHLASARAVAEGQADIAAIDAVTWRNIQAFEPFAKALRVLDWTTPTPGLPLIAARHCDPDVIFDAVQGALEKLSPEDADALGIKGLVRIPKAAYLSVRNPDDTISPPF